ncbi:hypothetical protein ACJMK2_044354 [Sinanodonta woodiana]|uniref:Uncharacterized protein n=1 Tax=Sinanodonta woodiana TaxID=1069815 RepID=A0ABD3W317_SINWO
MHHYGNKLLARDSAKLICKTCKNNSHTNKILIMLQYDAEAASRKTGPQQKCKAAIR